MPKDLIVEVADETTLRGPTVCLGIACNKYQPPGFWVPLVTNTSRITHFTWSQHGIGDFKKPESLQRLMAPRGALTDANRNRIAKYFLEETNCDYLLQMDDDVRLPRPLGVVLETLLAHNYPITAGIYYRGSEPHGPIAFIYARKEGGPRNGYVSLIDWEPNSMLPVDAVGMGCTLIHREVFERMQKEFVIVENWRGELRWEHPNNLEKHTAPSDRVLTIEEMMEEMSDAMLPFYALSYSRTEDFYFCENAKELGYDIWLDTSIEADHLQTWAVNRDSFITARRRGEIRHGKEPRVYRVN